MALATTIGQLRSSGRWNPFLRAFLLIVLWLVLGILYSFPLFAVVGLVPIARDARFGASAFSTVAILAQFLAALTVVWLFRRFLDRQSFISLGFERRPGWPGDLTWGLIFGSALMVLTTGVLFSFDWVELTGSGWRDSSVGGIVALSLLGSASLAVGAFSEELIARGYLVQNFAAGSNLVFGVLLSSAVFGAGHLANPHSSLLAALNTGLAGLLFALLYLRTGDLWAPIGAHFAWNLTQNYVFGLPVSGLDLFAGRSPLLLRESGPDLMTGGAFGPEGGLVVTVVLLAASAVIFLRVLRKERGID